MARQLGVSRATLHRMVEAGMVVPAQITASGYRRYSPADLHRFQAKGRAPALDVLTDTADAVTENLHLHGVLLDLAERLSGPHTAESLCMAAITVARDTLRSGDRASVWLADARGEMLEPMGSIGYPPSYDVSPFPIPSDSMSDRVLRTNQPVVCEDVMLHPVVDIDTERLRKAELQAFVVVPMVGPREVRGLLFVGCRHPAAFPTEDIIFLNRVAKMLAHSLENARVHDEYEQVYDILTKLSQLVEQKSSATELAHQAARRLGHLIMADVVLISTGRSTRDTPPVWLAVWTPDGRTIADLPPVPSDSTLRKQVDRDRKTLRIDDIHIYQGMSQESKRFAAHLDISRWQLAPMADTLGRQGAIALGFKKQRQLSQSALRSIALVATQLGLALGCIER